MNQVARVRLIWNNMVAFFRVEKRSDRSEKYLYSREIDLRSRRYSQGLMYGGVILIIVGIILWNSGSEYVAKTLIILDNSLSMDVQDIENTELTRLDGGKAIIDQVLQNNNEFALMTFAKDPILETPLTSDKDFIKNIATGIETVKQNGGSDIAKALHLASTIYGDKGINIILITDGGGSELRGRLPPFGRSTNFHIIAVGTKKGAMIPVGKDIFGRKSWKEINGEKIISTLGIENIHTLQKEYDAPIAYIDSGERIEDMIGKLHFNPSISTNMEYPLERIFFILGSILVILSYLVPRYKYYRAHPSIGLKSLREYL